MDKQRPTGMSMRFGDRRAAAEYGTKGHRVVKVNVSTNEVSFVVDHQAKHFADYLNKHYRDGSAVQEGKSVALNDVPLDVVGEAFGAIPRYTKHLEEAVMRQLARLREEHRESCDEEMDKQA